MVLKCEIQFDQNQYGTYFAGQVVSGKVVMSLDKNKSVRGIALKISGFSKTHWTESRRRGTGRDRRTERIHFNGREDYLSSQTYLVGSDDGNSMELSPGIHTYNFACTLPTSLPSSFEGTYGHTRYLVKVVLDRPWKFDRTYTVAFTVLKPVDLNYESPVLRMPAHAEVEKQFWWGFCDSNPLQIALNLPQSGYVPGQIIPCEVIINNNSSVPLNNVKLQLKKIVRYQSETPRKREKEETFYVTKKDMGMMNRRTFKKFIETLQIPAVPPTSTVLCKIIQVVYEVELEIRFRGAHRRLNVACPITIGTVPFMDVVQQQPLLSPHNNNQFQNSANNSYSSRTNNESGYHGYNNSLPVINAIYRNNSDISNRGNQSTRTSEIPPPTYEEVMYMKRARVTDENDKHPIETSDFLPRYPVYRFSTETSAPSAPSIEDN